MTGQNHFGPQTLGGQALVYVLALMVPLALTAALVFNSYQISNEKNRLQNTVDAAVYSGAVAEARNLNFMAYTNRAMIANQVAMAQAVGLVSWARWLDQVAFNLSVITVWFPGVNAVTRGIATASDRMLKVTKKVMDPTVTGLDFVTKALTKAQQAHNKAMVLIMGDMIGKVVQANDPDVDTGLSLLNAGLVANYESRHGDFTELVDRRNIDNPRNRDKYRRALARMEEKREITMESRDGFSRNRTYNRWGKKLPLIVQWDFKRSGSTDLTGANKRHRFGSWIAMDTFSLHVRFQGCGLFGASWCSWKETPIGWGAAKTSRKEEANKVRYNTKYHKRRENLGTTWKRNRLASRFANREPQSYREVKANRDGYSGLRSYMDLAADGLMTDGPEIQLILTKPASALTTNEDLGFNAGAMSLEDGAELPADRMAAMASAAPYFSRPNDLPSLARRDGRREYANAYNPYWQARLTSLGEAERRALQAAAAMVNF